MKDESEKTKEKKKSIEKISTELSPESIFTQDEIRDIVKGFIRSYVGGNIKIGFPTATEILEQYKFKSKRISKEEATQHEFGIKETFNRTISVCSGATPSTSEQYRVALSELFMHILRFRCSGRIEGKFVEYSVIERLEKLEEGLQITNDLVEELVEWIRSGVSR